MLKIPSEIILKPIYHITRRLAVVKFPSKLRQSKKSNFVFSNFGILLVCSQYSSKMVKNAKRISVAICFGSSNNLTGL